MPAQITIADLARDLRTVARALPEWEHGDAAGAVARTLRASARDLHARTYTLWVWTGRARDRSPVWILPVQAEQTRRFAPPGPARALARSLAALVLAGAAPEAVRVSEWHGSTALTVAHGEPVLGDPELAALALREAHPVATRVSVAALPEAVTVLATPLELPPSRTADAGLVALAHATGAHPVEVALVLADRGQTVDAERYPAELTHALREWGLPGSAPPPEPERRSAEIDDDPCPLRRHARRVLRRLLRMGKVGLQYHTEFDHLYRGAPPDARADARMVGEALVRAGLLGEKPSVGQRHVYLRREALPEIHALIERGETADPALRALWTAPAPGEGGLMVPGPSPSR